MHTRSIIIVFSAYAIHCAQILVQILIGSTLYKTFRIYYTRFTEQNFECTYFKANTLAISDTALYDNIIMCLEKNYIY